MLYESLKAFNELNLLWSEAPERRNCLELATLPVRLQHLFYTEFDRTDRNSDAMVSRCSRTKGLAAIIPWEGLSDYQFEFLRIVYDG